MTAQRYRQDLKVRKTCCSYPSLLEPIWKLGFHSPEIIVATLSGSATPNKADGCSGRRDYAPLARGVARAFEGRLVSIPIVRLLYLLPELKNRRVGKASASQTAVLYARTAW